MLLTWLVVVAAAVSPAKGDRVSFRAEGDRVTVEIGGKPFTAFHHGAAWHKPFLHPLRTPSGVVVSRGFPLEPAPGDSRDHVWHRGVWFAHGDINGADFWNEREPPKPDAAKSTKDPAKAGSGPKKMFGKLVPRSAPRTTVRGNRGELQATMDLVLEDGQTIGSLSLRFGFSRASGHNVIDVRSTLAADRGAPLTLSDSKEGTVGVRLAEEFRVDRGAVLVNSEGVSGKEIWGKRARWVDYSTSREGKKVGVSMMDDALNVRHPTHWHARDYGLCAANPFGAQFFDKDPNRDSSYVVMPGSTLTLQHRVVIRDGDLTSKDLDGLYAEFQRSARARGPEAAAPTRPRADLRAAAPATPSR